MFCLVFLSQGLSLNLELTVLTGRGSQALDYGLLAATWALGIWTQVLRLFPQGLYLLSHFLSPLSCLKGRINIIVTICNTCVQIWKPNKLRSTINYLGCFCHVQLRTIVSSTITPLVLPYEEGTIALGWRVHWGSHYCQIREAVLVFLLPPPPFMRPAYVQMITRRKKVYKGLTCHRKRWRSERGTLAPEWRAEGPWRTASFWDETPAPPFAFAVVLHLGTGEVPREVRSIPHREADGEEWICRSH